MGGRIPRPIARTFDARIPFLVWLLMLPLSLVLVFVMALGLTFFVRPLTFRQIFFTFVVPVVPLAYAWDGQTSYPRIYTLADLDELLAGPEAHDYVWEKGYAKTAQGKKLGIYLLGLPADV